MTVIGQRVLFSDNGVVSDLSMNLNKISALNSTIAYVAAEDFIYIGSDLPFNHKYINVSTVNDQASTLSIHIWNSTAWVPAVDVHDGTSVSGVALAQSGIIHFSPDRTESWSKEETSEDVTGISSLKIYRKYWLRLSWNNDLNANTALSYIGHKFADDTDFSPNGYPDLERSDVKTGFETGKTNWNEQHLVAAEAIVAYLKGKEELQKADQVLDWQQFEIPAVHKAAEIIFSGFGDDYEDDENRARERFLSAIEHMKFTVDRDGDGVIDDEDVFSRPHNFVRV